MRNVHVDVGIKKRRRILTKLRGGTAELREETGRWRGQPREERICTLCPVSEIEDVEHFLHAEMWTFIRRTKGLLAQMQKVNWC